MYDLPVGVPQDYCEALKWYRMAAEQGYADAQYNLGEYYMDGNSVPQDDVLAHLWFSLASSSAESESRDKAVKSRAFVAARMTATQLAEAQRLAREWEPK